MAKPVTQKIKLVAQPARAIYYVTKKNPRNHTEKLVFKKYDPVARGASSSRKPRSNSDCWTRRVLPAMLGCGDRHTIRWPAGTRR